LSTNPNSKVCPHPCAITQDKERIRKSNDTFFENSRETFKRSKYNFDIEKIPILEVVVGQGEV